MQFLTPENTTRTINGKVALATRPSIHDQPMVNGLIPSGFVKTDTLMVMANAAFFSGRWHFAFDPDETESQTFHGTKGPEVVQMMSMKGQFHVGA